MKVRLLRSKTKASHAPRELSAANRSAGMLRCGKQVNRMQPPSCSGCTKAWYVVLQGFSTEGAVETTRTTWGGAAVTSGSTRSGSRTALLTSQTFVWLLSWQWWCVNPQLSHQMKHLKATGFSLTSMIFNPVTDGGHKLGFSHCWDLNPYNLGGHLMKNVKICTRRISRLDWSGLGSSMVITGTVSQYVSTRLVFTIHTK